MTTGPVGAYLDGSALLETWGCQARPAKPLKSPVRVHMDPATAEWPTLAPGPRNHRSLVRWQSREGEMNPVEGLDPSAVTAIASVGLSVALTVAVIQAW